MKILLLATAIAASQLLAISASAQPVSAEEKAAARAERRQEGTAASKSFQPGEGQPIPEAKPKAPPEARSAARTERKATGAEAARGPQIGEGNPLPDAKPKVSSEERKAARAPRREEAARAEKAGEIKAKGEKSY